MRTIRIKRNVKTAVMLLIVLLLLTPQAMSESNSPQPTSKDFTFRAWLEGENYRVPFTGDTLIGESPVAALNLYFKNPYRGEYTIIVTAYNDYTPPLSGAKRYFSIAPSFDLTSDSSIEVNSTVDVAIYQLYGSGEWRRLSTKKVAEGVYRAPISALGVFAVREESLQIPVQPSVQQKKSLSERIQAKDWQTYNALHRYFDPILQDIARVIGGFLK